jgi:signal transduction histidine kinase
VIRRGNGQDRVAALGAAEERLRHTYTALETARDRLRDTIDRLPAVIEDLRSAVLEGEIRSALLDCARSSASAAQVSVVVTGDENDVPLQARAQVFLAIREALRNALAHARPRLVRIMVDIQPHRLIARIEDDGIGFDAPDAQARPTGTGLASIRERAALLGGSARVHSGPGSGTRVELSVPLAVQRLEGVA